MERTDAICTAVVALPTIMKVLKLRQMKDEELRKIRREIQIAPKPDFSDTDGML